MNKRIIAKLIFAAVIACNISTVQASSVNTLNTQTSKDQSSTIQDSTEEDVKTTTIDGWQLINNGWYYCQNGVKQTGWFTWNYKWYFASQKGKMQTGWIDYNGEKYYLNPTGDMKKSSWLVDKDKQYYFDANGKMLKYTITPDGWALNKDGAWDGKPQKNIMYRIKNVGNAEQAIVVTARNYGTQIVTIQTYEKVNNEWVPKFDTMDGVIGAHGFAEIGCKREGDLRSPQGIFTIGQAFGKLDNPGTTLEYRKLTGTESWDCNPGSPNYNKMIYNGNGSLLRSDWLFDYVLVINYNTENTISGAGSGIFFHEWQQQYYGTHGCTATTTDNVVKIMDWIDRSKNPVIIEGVESEIENF